MYIRSCSENWEQFCTCSLTMQFVNAVLTLQFCDAVSQLQFCILYGVFQNFWNKSNLQLCDAVLHFQIVDAVFNFWKQMQFRIFWKHFLPAICKPQCCKSNYKKTNSSSNSRNNYKKVNCTSHSVSPSSSDYMSIAFSDAHFSCTLCFLIFSLDSRINCFQYLSILDRRNETSSFVNFPA